MTVYSGQTDKVTKIQLPSAIELVIWDARVAAPGGLVHLDIFTVYIGNNSEVQIELSNGEGKALARYTERMAGSRFRVPIRVPAEARDELVATVKLPKHGLQKKSPALRVTPPVQVVNAAWNKKEARHGDILRLIADVKGIPDGVHAVVQIFEYAADGAHELLSKFAVPVRNKKLEAEWVHDMQIVGNAAQCFFRIVVAEVSGDSSLVELKPREKKS